MWLVECGRTCYNSTIYCCILVLYLSKEMITLEKDALASIKVTFFFKTLKLCKWMSQGCCACWLIHEWILKRFTRYYMEILCSFLEMPRDSLSFLEIHNRVLRYSLVVSCKFSRDSLYIIGYCRILPIHSSWFIEIPKIFLSISLWF